MRTSLRLVVTTPAAILVDAEAAAVRAEDESGSFGVLRPGFSADVLVVTGDPLADLTRLRDVVTVMAQGRLVHGRGR